MKSSSPDLRWMAEAIELAKKGIGTTSPNPRVGAVVVKDDKLVGSGFHAKAGLAHAEAIALKKAGKKAVGATLYVTLEPCSHFGRTPPCSAAVLRSGLKRVVIGEIDPNPLSNGKSVRELREAGLTVACGALAAEAHALNFPFHKWIRTKTPYVTLKLAQTLDGKIATSTGLSKWITSEESRQVAQEIRASVDAILVGYGTVQADDPRLSVRIATKNHPAKVILDSKLSISPRAKLFRTPGRVILATTEAAPKAKRLALEKKCEVLVVPSRHGRVDAERLLAELGSRDILHLLIEGGGETAASFLRLADEAFIFTAPKILGGRDAVTSIEGDGFPSPASALRLDRVTVRKVGPDFLFHGFF